MPDAKTPDGLSSRGARLWLSLLAQDSLLEDETNPMREVALQACRTADRLEDIDSEIASAEDRLRLLAEERQQSQAMARLISALRLPDEATGKKPQRRQLRGVQKPSSVSSLDRMREQSQGA
jgi:hypothetical protein